MAEISRHGDVDLAHHAQALHLQGEELPGGQLRLAGAHGQDRHPETPADQLLDGDSMAGTSFSKEELLELLS